MGHGETTGTESEPSERLVGELDDSDALGPDRSDALRAGSVAFDRKWSASVLNRLRERPHRFSELGDELGLSAKVLTDTLTPLREERVVDRDERSGESWVEYSLTERGEAFGAVLDAAARWNEEYGGTDRHLAADEDDSGGDGRVD